MDSGVLLWVVPFNRCKIPTSKCPVLGPERNILARNTHFSSDLDYVAKTKQNNANVQRGPLLLSVAVTAADWEGLVKLPDPR